MAYPVRLPIMNKEDLDEAIKDLSEDVKVQKIAFGAIFGAMTLLLITVLFISGKCLLGGTSYQNQADSNTIRVIE